MQLAQLKLEPLPEQGSIDAGADEELFRQMARQTAGQALAVRWEAADKAPMDVCPRCGTLLVALGRRRRQLQTLCGTVKIRRQVYYCGQCRKTQAPLDERLGVDQTGIMPGLTRVICRTALELPYQQSQQLLTDTLGFSPCSAREIERRAKRHGVQLEQLLASSEDVVRVVSQRRHSRPVYCLAIDGTMIPGLPDLQQHRLHWHEVKLATLFDPRGIRPTLYIAGREDAESFGVRLWKQWQGHQLDREGLRLILGDGAAWIWNLVATHFPGVPQLLDFYHAAQHLYQTAQAVWPAVTAKSWWQRRLDQLQQAEIENFFAALKWLARRHQTADPDVSPERLLQYFQENRERLNYQWALRNHLPIGSGSVESAARHIVQQRLKQSGMRWSDSGAQAILNLRTLHRNGGFENYWENYAACGR